MGLILGWNVEKICLYPYGGVTKFNEDINRQIKEELLILLAGPLTQIIYLMIGKSFFHDSIFIYYNLSILIFNLLPIYPLDGGRIINLFFNYFFPFRFSYYLSITISFIMSFLFIFISLKRGYTLNIILMFLIVIFKTIEELRKRNYYFNKFLLERHLKKYYFKKVRVVKSIKKMMRDYRHIIKKDDIYYTEKDYLNKLYRSK